MLTVLELIASWDKVSVIVRLRQTYICGEKSL